jgi:uncharacterized protein (DUF2062 family)
MLATLLHAHLPLALDGESANQSNTGLAVISVVSIVLGYVLLAALWYFVFSAKAQRKREKRKRSGSD